MDSGTSPSQEPYPPQQSPRPDVPPPYRPDVPPPYTTYPTYPPYQPYQQPYAPYGAPPPPAPPRQGGVPWYVWLIGGCLGLTILVGIACVVLGVTFGRLVNTLARETPVSTTTTQPFSVTGAPTINVHDIDGQVTIMTGSAGAVTVEITKNARDTSPNAAQSDLDNITVTATQTGNTITVDTQFAAAQSLTRQLTADLTITVPPTANLALHVEAGSVEVDGVSGTVSATIGAGDFGASGVTLGDGSRIDVSTGTVTLDGALASGASVSVTVSTGDAQITLSADTSTHLDASTDLGGITISGWSIPITRSGLGAKASGDLGASPSGALTVHVATGSIMLTRV
jgi:hypothetical protein